MGGVESSYLEGKEGLLRGSNSGLYVRGSLEGYLYKHPVSRVDKLLESNNVYLVRVKTRNIKTCYYYVHKSTDASLIQGTKFIYSLISARATVLPKSPFTNYLLFDYQVTNQFYLF